MERCTITIRSLPGGGGRIFLDDFELPAVIAYELKSVEGRPWISELILKLHVKSVSTIEVEASEEEK